jgi:hypothetical protein
MIAQFYVTCARLLFLRAKIGTTMGKDSSTLPALSCQSSRLRLQC